MRLLVTCLIAAVVLAPFAALAQSTDAQYCQKLADLYRTTNGQNMDAAAPEDTASEWQDQLLVRWDQPVHLKREDAR